MTSDSPLWTPTADQIDRARLTHFRRSLQQRGVIDESVSDAHALQRWSVNNPETFWAEIWRAADIVADGPGPEHAPWSDVLVGGDHMAPPTEARGPRPEHRCRCR